MKLFYQKLGLSFLLGCVASFSTAPHNYWLLMLLGLAGMYVLTVSAKNLKRAFWYAFMFSYAYFAFSLSWVGNALLVEGNLYSWVYPFALLGAPLLINWVFACSILIFKQLYNAKSFSGPFAFAGLVTLGEWIRGTFLFAGFPWNTFGYSWNDLLPVTQIIVFDNIYLLSFISALWAGLIGFLFVSRNRRAQIASALMVVISFFAVYGFGQYRLSTHETEFNESVNLAVIQPNIKQADKWNPALFEENFSKHIQLSRAHASNTSDETTYIIWPETAITYRHTSDPTSQFLMQSVLDQYENNAYILSGMLRYYPEKKEAYNSLILLDRDLEMQNVYDKHHLVPFGEYIPFQSWIPIKTVTQFSGFVRGKGPTHMTTPRGHTYSPLICYESIFPDEVLAENQSRPDFLLNIANDAWYGESAGPHQHFVQGRFRAIELGIPFVRSTGTGISGIVDSLGRIVEKSELFESTALHSKLPKTLSQEEISFFLKGYIFLVFICFSLVIPVIQGIHQKGT